MNVYDRVTDTIAAAIERGAADPKGWRMPWHRKGGVSAGMPYNATTGRAYTGGNTLTLWCAQDALGYSSPRWATFKQWQGVGAQVRKGEKATLGMFFKRWEPKDGDSDDTAGDDGETRKRGGLLARAFFVFNAAQVDGDEGAKPFEPSPDLTAAHAAADAVIAASGARITHAGVSAYYRPATDEVVMPERWRFLNTDSGDATQRYYSVMMHELTHWTGHTSRLDRETLNKYSQSRSNRAFEELVAELGAAFACARLGIDNEPRADHANYMASWLTCLQDDRKAIVSAASQAQKACDYLLNRLAAPVVEPLPLAA